MVGVNTVALHYNPVRVRRAQDDQHGFRFIHHHAGARRTDMHFRDVAPVLHLCRAGAAGVPPSTSSGWWRSGAALGRCLGVLRCQLRYNLRQDRIKGDFILRKSGNRQGSSRRG